MEVYHPSFSITDYYGQQSCTAGRAAFITGQSPMRTGLLKVGLPAAKEGLSEKDPTIAELLKPQGYTTGQFGKNHLGDRNEFLPTVHGFDEFFGNLYHLNAEDEPEHPDYPKDPAFRAQFGPRGVMKCVATATDTPGEDSRFGSWGKQKCEDTGPLTKKRMETIDEEFLKASIDFIDRANRDRKPFFVWFNSSRMHIWTRLKPESQGKTGLGIYPDGMVEHDGQVGELLKKLDDLGIADNTIVIYTTDNGAETFSWPDGGATPFRGEKNTNWEGGYRVPAMVRWPGLVPPRTEINDIFSAEDWTTTLVAAAGEPDIKNKLLQGYDAAGKNFKVHLDGYDQRDLLARKGPNQRREFFYWTDDGNLAGLRYEQWKAVFLEQKAHGFDVWAQPMVRLRLPSLLNLRSDPFERAQHEAGDYVRWFVEHAFVLVPEKRDDWPRAWKWLKPVFGDRAPSEVQPEHFLSIDSKTGDVTGLIAKIEMRVSPVERHRVIKVWRALWKKTAAMGYCKKEADPTLTFANTQPQPRQDVWQHHEVLHLVEHAWTRTKPKKGLAALMAVIWDSMLSPGDARTLTPAQMSRDSEGALFFLDRAKTGRAAAGTLTPWSEAILAAYLESLGADLFDHAPMFRTSGSEPGPKGGRRWLPVPDSKDKAEKDFAVIPREVFGKAETRQLADMRRSGAVEADAGGTTDADLANKMANTINASARLRKTYTPVNVVSVRRVDEARQRGRKAIRDMG